MYILYEARTICGLGKTVVLWPFNHYVSGNIELILVGATETIRMVPWFLFAFTAKQIKSREAVSYYNLCVWHPLIIYLPGQRKKFSERHLLCRSNFPSPRDMENRCPRPLPQLLWLPLEIDPKHLVLLSKEQQRETAQTNNSYKKEL